MVQKAALDGSWSLPGLVAVVGAAAVAGAAVRLFSRLLSRLETRSCRRDFSFSNVCTAVCSVFAALLSWRNSEICSHGKTMVETVDEQEKRLKMPVVCGGSVDSVGTHPMLTSA